MDSELLKRYETIGSLFLKSGEALADDESPINQTIAIRRTYYDRLERLYSNEVYNRADSGSEALKVWAALPKDIRPISMIAKRAVDWWPGHVYGGAFTDDGLPTSNGRPNKVPYDQRTKDKLRLASQQVLSWAGGAAFLARYCRLGAMLGEFLVEVGFWTSPDVGGDKVYPHIVHPANVVSLDLSPRGDVQKYRVAEQRWDREKLTWYTWSKEVTKDTVTTYYNDEPQGFDGMPASWAHPYGFCPAVWVRFTVGAGHYGYPAIQGIVPTLDEYQGLLSTIDDYIHRFVRQGALVESEDPDLLQGYLAAVASRRRGVSFASVDQSASRQIIGIRPAPAGTKVHHLIQNLGLADADSHIERIKEELWQALPEIVLQERLLEMDQVTAPGALPLVQQVQAKLDDVTANLDKGLIAIIQQTIAIGGHLIKTGEWGLGSQLSKAQKKLGGFNLDSFAAGDLDFTILPRELIPLTFEQKASQAMLLEKVQYAFSLRMMGFSEKDIYGEAAGAIPDPKLGILEERSQNAPQAGSISQEIDRLFQSGNIGEPGQTQDPQQQQGQQQQRQPAGAAA